jgi:hypothetical protein
MTIYLNLYDVGQAYGGSEEGGWWYSVGEYLETVGTFATRDAAKAARATLEETRIRISCPVDDGVMAA